MFNGPGVNHRRAVKVHYPSRYLVHKCLDAQWLSAKFLHGIQQHRPEIAGRGAINQQIQAGKLRLAGVDDDGIRPSHRGLCDLAGGKGSRAQVNPTLRVLRQISIPYDIHIPNRQSSPSHSGKSPRS